MAVLTSHATRTNEQVVFNQYLYSDSLTVILFLINFTDYITAVKFQLDSFEDSFLMYLYS